MLVDCRGRGKYTPGYAAHRGWPSSEHVERLKYVGIYVCTLILVVVMTFNKEVV